MRLDDLVELLLRRRDQRDGAAGLAGAAGATRAVHVVLERQREVVVDHQLDVVDVDAATGDVGRDQEARAAARERAQTRVAGLGALVAVDRVRGQTGALQHVAELLAADLLVAEDQHLAVLATQQALERVRLVADADRGEAVRDRARRLAAAADLHALGAGQEVLDQRLDLLGERRGEQQVLPLVRHAQEHAPDLRHEAHVEHAVGLVEHDHLDVLERDVAALEVVDQASRAGDEHVQAALEGALLDRQVDAAERGADVQAGVLGVGAEVLGDLYAQLARRHDDQAAQARLAAAEAVEHRQAERRGLAAAGLAEPDQLVAVEDLGDRVLLDLGRLFVAGVAHALEDGLLQPEGFETHGDVRLVAAGPLVGRWAAWLMLFSIDVVAAGPWPTHLVATHRKRCPPKPSCSTTVDSVHNCRWHRPNAAST